MVALGEGTRDIRCRGSYAMVANMKWVWEWSCCCFHVVMLACQAPKRARLAASPNINRESPLTNRRGCRPSNAKEIKTSMPAGQKCMNDDRKRVVGRTALLSMCPCRLEESSSQCRRLANGGLNSHLGGGLPTNHLRLEALALFVTAGPAPSFTVHRGAGAGGESRTRNAFSSLSSLQLSFQEATRPKNW